MSTPGGAQQGSQPVQQQQASAPSAQPQPPQQISSEMVQKYLEENETLITTIVENIDANRLKEASQYQTRLQQNLMYLAAIADQNPAPQQLGHN